MTNSNRFTMTMLTRAETRTSNLTRRKLECVCVYHSYTANSISAVELILPEGELS